MSPTAGTACIACIACKGCLNWCAPLHLRTNAHSLQAQGFSPHGAQSSPDEASRATRPRGGRAGASGLLAWELGPVGYRYGSWGQSAPLRCSCAVGKHGTREATPTRKTGASRIGSDGPKLTSCFCKESTDHLAISVCMLK